MTDVMKCESQNDYRVSVEFHCLAKSLLGYNLTCLPSRQLPDLDHHIPSETDDWGMSQHQERSGSLHK